MIYQCYNCDYNIQFTYINCKLYKMTLKQDFISQYFYKIKYDTLNVK